MYEAVLIQICVLAGKLGGPPGNKAGTSYTDISNRLFVKCRKHNIPFLVDTGASISIIPNNLLHWKRRTHDQLLFAANGTSIATYGQFRTKVILENEAYEWLFIVADVKRPIIGADFLSYFGLHVDLKNRQLYNPHSRRPIPGYVNTINTGVSTKSTPPALTTMLAKYEPAQRPSSLLSSIKHHIED
ncbi:hypothetical protein GE061_005725 [Apolygus lucorum]|uniref:Peptidase A2 domain-containing protein n=1 Tax=Apolygus lucorum TaxID=248454 RepID=A0A8S9WYT5_APOLU|nr:hypothetical protein GE061_005725 [Apolygus lucorum]